MAKIKQKSQIKPSKVESFEAFIKILHTDSIGSWVSIAQAVGVDRNTIQKWRELPEAKEAIQKGIDYNIQRMTKVGADDWRMWKERNKLFGVNPDKEIDITSQGEKIEGLVIYRPEPLADDHS